MAFYKREQIEDLRQRVILQRNAFEELHIPISQLKSLEIIPKGKVFYLVATEKFEGLDFVDVVDSENFDFYIDKVLSDIYKPLLKSTGKSHLSAGIDTAIRNYVYRFHEGEFCYVDFMPPKVFYKNHYTQEVPEIEGPFYDIRMISHNERAGIVYSLYINLARVYPEKRKFISSKLEQFLEMINESELKKYLTNSPFYRIGSRKEAVEVVKSLSDWKAEKYFHLREAACIAAEENPNFKAKLPEFFKLTHHETDTKSHEYGLLPQKRFEQAKKLLIKELS